MTYKEVLAFLYRQLPMYQRLGKKAFKKDLSNTIALCLALNGPEKSFPSIHIAGTNGKGSTSHMLAGILQASGLKVGLYTSPHYKDFRERIKINGKKISKSSVVKFVLAVDQSIHEIEPSFFELTVAMAFDHFRNNKVDIAVIETGLGGRLDSTNVLKPLCSVITNIGFDHQDMLGDTLEAIAREKAGIIKKDTPIVIGRYQKETHHVFESIAKKRNASLFYAENLLQIKVGESNIYEAKLQANYKEDRRSFNLLLAQPSAYNIENCRTALATIETLNQHRGMKITEDAIIKGLKDFPRLTGYMGRWQIKQTQPIILLDAAHNEDGIKELTKELRRLDYNQLHVVFGAVKDKDLAQILTSFPVSARFYFARPNVPRGRSAKEVKEIAQSLGLKGRQYVSCLSALKAAKRAAKEADLILVTGSSFVVAELV